MSDYLQYKGYTGTVEYSAADNLLCGEVRVNNNLLMYDGSSLAKLKQDFEDAVDEYLNSCRTDGIEPEKPVESTDSTDNEEDTKDFLGYKGYTGTVEYSESDNLLYGQVRGIKSLISYEGTTLAELKQDFKGALDDYLLACKERGTNPEKPVETANCALKK